MQKKGFKFSSAVDRLEELVERLSTEELDLEEALSLFEEGIRLSVECLKKLEEAKSRIEFLIKESEEAFKRVEAEPEDLAEIGAQVTDELGLDAEGELDSEVDNEEGADQDDSHGDVDAGGPKRAGSKKCMTGSKRARNLFEE